jgi:hypothetical protein
MAKTKISEFDANPANNTDIDGINLAEGMAPGLVNNAIRQLMAQLKDFQIGSAGDNLTVGGNLVVTGSGTLSGRTIDALPSGTKMLFQQTAAPTGWTKDTTHDNKALRIVSGTAGSGGSVAFTTAFASRQVTGTTDSATATNNAATAVNNSATAGGTVGDHTLTLAQVPSHQHFIARNVNSSISLSSANVLARVYTPGNTQGYDLSGTSGTADIGRTNSQGGNGAHSHSFTGASHNHTQEAHNHTQNAHTHTLTGAAIDLTVQYVDVIICTKS